MFDEELIEVVSVGFGDITMILVLIHPWLPVAKDGHGVEGFRLDAHDFQYL